MSAAALSSGDTLPLRDRVAIITGGSSGIGRAIALHLSSLGARLLIIYSTNFKKAEMTAASGGTRTKNQGERGEARQQLRPASGTGGVAARRGSGGGVSVWSGLWSRLPRGNSVPLDIFFSDYKTGGANLGPRVPPLPIATVISAVHRNLGAAAATPRSPPVPPLTAAEINSGEGVSPRAAVYKVDVSDPVQVKSMFDAAESVFGSPVDIFVNSAAIFDPKNPTIAGTAVEDFDRIFAVNARGAFLCCREAANRIKRGGGGRIICLTTSNVAALRPNFGAYAASKAAVETMVKILSKELKGTGITANCVAPGATGTDYFYTGKTTEMLNALVNEVPLGRLGLPEDISPVVALLATDAGGWVNGQVIRVNGGAV